MTNDIVAAVVVAIDIVTYKYSFFWVWDLFATGFFIQSRYFQMRFVVAIHPVVVA
jgi:hypothetical protein